MRNQLFTAAVFALGLLPAIATADEASTTIWLSPSTKVAEGAYWIDRGELRRGMDITLKALEEDLMADDRAAALNNLCTAKLALKRPHDAIQHCSTAVAIRRNLWQGYNNRGNAYLMLGNYDAAISDYNRALMIRPEMRVLEYNLTMAIDRKARKVPPMVEERES